MPMAPFNNITAVYSTVHAWMYETIVAPAVYESRHVIDEHFLPYLPHDASILDVGSGGGLFTKYIADQRPDVRITGIDLSQPQIKRAVKRMRRYGERIRFQLGDATPSQVGPSIWMRRVTRKPNQSRRQGRLPHRGDADSHDLRPARTMSALTSCAEL